ncbi:hypothetical protein HZC53_05760 [Candidatus Uhrbacteria bacterium]|nr:hypothetical protein [Candidatus Uhrbacteria bacterium]
MEIGSTGNQLVGEEAMEGRPLWLTCCIGCLFLAAAMVAGSFVAAVVFAGPGVASIKSLPEGFPSELNPYKIERATNISYLSGSSRGKIFRVLTAPVRLINDLWPKKIEPETGVVVSTAPFRVVWSVQSPKPETWFDKYSLIAQGLDSVTMSWDNLDVSREELVGYYTDLFKSAGMKTSTATETTTRTDYLIGTKQGAAMQVHIQASTDKTKIERAVVVVTYMNKK